MKVSNQHGGKSEADRARAGRQAKLQDTQLQGREIDKNNDKNDQRRREGGGGESSREAKR